MISSDKFLNLLQRGNTSYKYFYLLGCVDSIIKSKKQYDFDFLGQYMIAEAILYGDFAADRYTKNDRLYDVVVYLYRKDDCFSALTDINTIFEKINENKDEYVCKMIHQLTLYVPYRLLATDDINRELTGLMDWQKNSKIEKLSYEMDTIYMISGKTIIWKDDAFDFVIMNKENLKRDIINELNKKFNRK